MCTTAAQAWLTLLEQIWEQLGLTFNTLDQGNYANECTSYGDTIVLLFRLAASKNWSLDYSDTKKCTAAAVKQHFADIRPPDCMIRVSVAEIVLDMTFSLNNQQAHFHQNSNIECSDFVALLDIAIRKTISAGASKIDSKVARIERSDLIHSLDELMPSIWRPGYATVNKFDLYFLPWTGG